ncbi:ubiquinol oxidase subunit II [Sphingomonas aracearum]|uniref:Ubiquinol oxidase subunit 2 n=2 Tax=Sphingomonas aracearum TaxID=2283317 RepID=A0A369VZD8_9SPHN|nr:ubiquinol oxidase subunit II [Sphingomonas aracearum]
MIGDAFRSRLRRACAATVPLLLSGCVGTGVLNPHGPIAGQNRTILFNSLAIMLAIVVPTILATLVFAWWYRAGNDKATYRPEFTFSGRIELLVWSIPILTILFLGGVIWVGSHQLDPARPIESNQKALEVEVVSTDWKWLFIYPEQGIATVNRLVVPVGRPVHFRLTSSSVMNVFFVPQLVSQIYTMNGMATQLNMRADTPGRYYSTSAHYSGDGFSDMNFATDAVPAAQFEGWVAQARARGRLLDRPAYEKFAQQSQKVPPGFWGQVQPGLFDAVVRQEIKPAAGPQEGRGGPRVSPGDES